MSDEKAACELESHAAFSSLSFSFSFSFSFILHLQS